MNKNEDYILGDNELLEVKSDRLFHDLFNKHEMNTIEWTVMMILEKSYEEIHGNVKVGNIRLTNMSKDDKQKFVNLIVEIDNKKIIIELNKNDEGSYLSNTLYALNAINNSYIESGNYYGKKIQGILINLNWIKSEYKRNYSKKEIIYSYPKEEELKKFIEEEQLLNNYYRKMDRLPMDKEYCRMVWDERLDEILRKADAYFGGKDDGIREDIEQRTKELIINMYHDNLPLETIAKYTNLSIDEVNRIINN